MSKIGARAGPWACRVANLQVLGSVRSAHEQRDVSFWLRVRGSAPRQGAVDFIRLLESGAVALASFGLVES